MATRIGVTLGDPRGIGPEVAVRAADRIASLGRDEADLLLIGPEGMGRKGIAYESVGVWNGSAESAGRIARASLEGAVRRALAGTLHAVVTGPVHKPALHAAGWSFPGQTEVLRELTGAAAVGMLMTAERTEHGPPLRVLLATTHLPLREAPGRLSASLLTVQTELLAQALRRGWRIEIPRIALCALNPHGSDGGLFGDEEGRVYLPALQELRRRGFSVAGPIPADTVFTRALRGEFDAVVAPYHDVGMAAFKTVSFGAGVNVTLGLPFVRTSPDHGVAFDIAGKGLADPSSMVEAIRLAVRLHGARSAEPMADRTP